MRKLLKQYLKIRQKFWSVDLIQTEKEIVFTVKEEPLLKLYRNRYIAFKIISESVFSADDIVHCIWRMLLSLFGEVGGSRTNFWLIEYSETGYGILRCTHTSVDVMKSVLSTIIELKGFALIIDVLGISGTIKGSRRFFQEVVNQDREINKS
jgi:ribonuclease P/MRP protein subunit POP5